MGEDARKRILTAAERGHHGLVRLYPRRFRDAYGGEIERTFSDLAREVYKSSGLTGLLWLELRALWDTLVSASREHRDLLTDLADRPRESGFFSVVQDLRYAVRYLVRQPAWTLVITATLALGIGATAAIFSVIHAVLLRPLPLAEPEKAVVLKLERADGVDRLFSLREVAALKAGSTTLEGLAEHHAMTFNLYDDDGPERVRVGVVPAGYFELLGVRPILGRVFRPADEGGDPVLLVGHDYWRERLDGDPGVVGRMVEMNDHQHRIVGVLPPLPSYPEAGAFFMPITSCPFRMDALAKGDLDWRSFAMIARLADGVPRERAEEELAGVVVGLNEEHPLGGGRERVGVVAVPLQKELTREARPTLLVLLGAVAFVLLIVCANVANLTLARLIRREPELAVRAALGAGRGRLVRQLTAESLLLALLGGVLGLAVAHQALGLLTELASRFTTVTEEIAINSQVVVFTLAVVLGTGLLLGLLPAHPRSARLVEGLKDGVWGRFSHRGRQRPQRPLGRRGGDLQRLLVVVQLAVSFMLLVGAGLMFRTLAKLHQVDPGFTTDNVLTMTLDLDWSRYDGPPKRRTFFYHLLESLDAEDDVLRAAVGGTYPFSPRGPGQFTFQMPDLAGDDGPARRADHRSASVGFFETLGIPILQGRGFTAADDLDAPRVVVVNESMARHYWGEADPVGEELLLDNGEAVTIVGVAGDIRQHGLAKEVEDEVYTPLRQAGSRVMSVLVRTDGDPQAMARRMRQAVREIDPRQPVNDLRTLEQVKSDELEPSRLTSLLLGLFAVLALGLSTAGVSGVLSFFVSRRTHEIGVRMALGAARGAVLRMVLGEGLVLVVLGLAVGAAGALALSRAMTGLLYDVGPSDPLTFLGTAFVLLAVAAAACFVPARWATRVQPVDALRQD